MILVNLYQRRNRARYQKIIQCSYTLFLLHLPYSINKAIKIRVFYIPWHHHCVIWVMNMRQNISSGVIKNVFWKFIIKVGYTSAVIFLWGIANKKTQKIINYRIEEWHTSTPYDLFRNHYTYLKVCLLLDMWHRTDHCIKS